MVRARFALKHRCNNCRRLMWHELISPDIEDAPADIEELRGSALLERQRYSCLECDHPITTLVSIKMIAVGEPMPSVQTIEPEIPSAEQPQRAPGKSASGNLKFGKASALLRGRQGGLGHGVGGSPN